MSSAGGRWSRARTSKRTDACVVSEYAMLRRFVANEDAFDILPGSAEKPRRSLARHPRDMRGQQQPLGGFIIERQQRIAAFRWFGGVNVDGRAVNAAGREAGGERRLVDNSPARGLDQYRTRLHLGEFARADEMARLRQQRHMQRD